MLIGEKIEAIRKALGIERQGDMAKSLGLEQGSYSDIVRGKTKKISGSVIKLLEVVHGINVDYLNGTSENMFQNSSNLVQEPAVIYKTTCEKELLEIKHLKNEIDLLREQIGLYKMLLNKK